MDFERIFTENAISSIWNRLDILTTFNGVKEELTRKKDISNHPITEELINIKSKGVAFCIRSARDQFKQSDSSNLTSSLTLLYYATYNLFSALLIADITNSLTLENIESFSKNGGHGLKTLYSEDSTSLADSEFVYGCNNGFFPELLKHWGYDKDIIVCPTNFKKLKDVDSTHEQKIISLKDLLSRIPELKNLYIEIFKEQPNYISYHAEGASEEGPMKIIISPKSNSKYLKLEQINDILGLPPEYKFELAKERESSLEESYISESPIPQNFIQYNAKQSSPIAPSCNVKPLLGIEDPMIHYFMTLYLLSIWTRYRPNLWREVCDGKFDKYRSIFSMLIVSTERIIPNLFINKFYDRKFLFAGHSYLS